MQAFFKDLFEYNQYQNRQFIEIAESQQVPKKVLELLSHILNAHQIWLNRVAPGGSAPGVWSEYKVTELATINDDLFSQSLKLLESADLNQEIVYSNTAGKIYTNSLQEILMHLINHGTHHRGQVAALLRAADIQPPVTDYIFYKRN